MKTLKLLIMGIFAFVAASPSFAIAVTTSGNQGQPQTKQNVKAAVEIKSQETTLVQSQEATEAQPAVDVAYDAAKKSWQTLKEDIKANRSKTKSEEKLKTASSFALKSIERIIAHLQRAEVRIDKSTVIGTAEKVELKTKIDAEIAIFEALKTKAQAIKTKAELQSLAKEIKAQMVKTKVVLKTITNSIHETHLKKMIDKLMVIATRLEKSTGSAIDVQKIKAAVLEAKTLLTQAQTQADDQKFKEAKELMVQARLKLNEALKLANQAGKTKEGVTENE